MNRPPRIIAPLLPVAVSMMAGIATGYYHPQDSLITLLAAIAVLAVATLLGRHPRWQTAAIWLCCAVGGHWLAARQLQQLRTPPRSHDLIVCSTPVNKGKTIVMDALTADGKKVRLRMMYGAPVSLGCGLHVSAAIRPVGYHPLYFDSHGYCGEVFAGYRQWHPKRVGTGGLSFLQRTRLRLLAVRQQLLERYRLSGIDRDVYAVTAAMTLGDKSAISQDLRETFSSTGTSHVLALSGLHLGIVYWLVVLLTAGRRHSIIVQVATVLAIWAYAFLTGLAPSIVRAALMLSLYSLLAIGHRDKMSVNALAFAAIAMLTANPLLVFDVGFQLSYAAVLAILLFFPLLNGLVSPRFLQRHRLAAWLWGMAALSTAAQLGTAPLVACHFGHFTPYFLLSNFVVIPMAYVIIMAALLLLATRLSLFATLLSATVTATISALARMARLPGALIDGLQPSLLEVALLYVIIACLYVLLRNVPYHYLAAYRPAEQK